MSGMCEERDCSACGVVSYVARRSDGGLCAECQLCRIDDEVVLDALSRAICAVIADAVKDEQRHAIPRMPTMTQAQSDEIQRKQDAKATDERRLAEQVAWANVTNEVKPCPHGRPKGCACSVCWPDEAPNSREVSENKYRFVSKNKPAMTAEQAMQVAAMRRNAEAANIQPRGHSPEDRFYPSDVPSYTADEVRAAMAPHPDLVRAEKAEAARIEELNAAYPLPGATSTHADDRCARCNSDMSYADPGQKLCYGCRSI